LETKTKTSNIREVLATRVRQTFRYRINFNQIALADLDEMKAWCENNCKDLWHCESYHALYFQFDGESDALMFNLKFGSRGKQ